MALHGSGRSRYRGGLQGGLVAENSPCHLSAGLRKTEAFGLEHTLEWQAAVIHWTLRLRSEKCWIPLLAVSQQALRDFGVHYRASSLHQAPRLATSARNSSPSALPLAHRLSSVKHQGRPSWARASLVQHLRTDVSTSLLPPGLCSTRIAYRTHKGIGRPGKLHRRGVVCCI